jgi:hypothetical protein
MVETNVMNKYATVNCTGVALLTTAPTRFICAGLSASLVMTLGKMEGYTAATERFN